MIDSLQSLRWIFVMLVVLSHLIGKAFDFGGECGVSFFFILSGFVLSIGYGQKVEEKRFQTKRFLLRQVSKFYPLHILTMAIILLCDVHLGRFTALYKLIPNILLVQSWIPFDEFYFVANGSSWFLSDILFFYCMFCLLYRKMNTTSTNALTAIVSVVFVAYMAVASIVPDDFVNSILYASPITRLLDFSIGILLHRFYHSQRTASFRHWMGGRSFVTITQIELFMLSCLLLSFFIYPLLDARYHCASMFWFILPAFIYIFSLTDDKGGVVTQFLHLKFMQWLGGISFEIYMIHIIIIRLSQSLLQHFEITEYHTAILYIVSICMTIVCSYLTKKYFCDKIYLSLIKHVTKI